MFNHQYWSAQYFPPVWFAPGDEEHLTPEERRPESGSHGRYPRLIERLLAVQSLLARGSAHGQSVVRGRGHVLVVGRGNALGLASLSGRCGICVLGAGRSTGQSRVSASAQVVLAQGDQGASDETSAGPSGITSYADWVHRLNRREDEDLLLL